MTTSLSAARLVLYSLISAIEDDLRGAVAEYLVTAGTTEYLLGAEIYDAAVEKLQKDRGTTADLSDLRSVLDYTEFLEPLRILNTHSEHLPEPLASHLKSVTGDLELVAPVRNRVMHRRPLDYEDLFVTREVAEKLVHQEPKLWFETADTIARLDRDPSFVLGLEIPVIPDVKNDLHNLPTPDFDETGFLGRRRQVSDVSAAIRGPYPVISLIGEGGVGKTALAIKSAFEILDSIDLMYDQIVWVSAKRFYLQGEQLQEIREAVTDSLGLIGEVADALGPGTETPVEEVLEYLTEFRILLILDNVETVLDQDLHQFLRRLPIGSKVVITSRIGIGSMELPIRLMPMSNGEATQLLRAVSAVRGVRSLKTAKQEVLADYSRRMDNNPGWIKWFVAAVQAGKRPEEVLAHPDIFLDFCMSNIYEHLTGEAKNVLAAMAAIGLSFGQSELEHLTEMPVHELQRSLQDLLTTNMVHMEIDVGEGIQRTSYSVGELARGFLARHKYSETVDDQTFQRRWKSLVAGAAQVGREHLGAPYRLKTFKIRTAGDYAVVKHLRGALAAQEAGQPDHSASLVELAESLAPDYFEVFRVKAYLRTKARDMPGARRAYEEALRLEPKHAPLFRAYGLFLMGIDELEDAKAMFGSALSLDPDSAQLGVDSTSCLLRLGEYQEADERAGTLWSRTDLALQDRIKVADLRIQCSYRQADRCSHCHDFANAYAYLEQMYRRFLELPAVLVDATVVGRLEKTGPIFDVCIERGPDPAVVAPTQGLRSRFEEAVRNFAEVRQLLPGRRYCGIVAMLSKDRPFGFIRMDYGEDLYFNQNKMRAPGDWYRLTQETRVNFVAAKTARGNEADDVVLDSGSMG